MHWQTELIDRLRHQPVCGYEAGAAPASEPTALAALALHGHGQDSAAARACNWLKEIQSPDGSVGVRKGEPQPRWPTSLALLAWLVAASDSSREQQRAVNWILGARGRTFDPVDIVGHDPSIVAWSWVEDTHCWIEPTAMHVLALKAARRADHQRTREAVRMLQNRLLPDGGCNYGNTAVLGQTLRPQVMPTGLALLALAGEADPDGRMARSLDYLAGELSVRTSAASLSYGLLALAAHRRLSARESRHLEAAYRRTTRKPTTKKTSPYHLALLALAALGESSPLVTITTTGAPS